MKLPRSEGFMLLGKLPLIVLSVILWGTAGAQTIRFDVATVKIVSTGPSGPSGFREGRYQARGLSVQTLLSIAYEMDGGRISGPKWIGSTFVDIDALPPTGTTESQGLVMLQALLAERFKLVLHKEQKEADVFEMVAAKGGLKLPSTTPKEGPRAIGMGGTVDMKRLAAELSGRAGRPVLDATGREGTFLYFLDFDPRPNSPSGLPDFLTAAQEQLGIKLQPKKAVIDFIVVDRGEPIPTEN
jgi:uncharacterized protein (TIGR03435 family)